MILTKQNSKFRKKRRRKIWSFRCKKIIKTKNLDLNKNKISSNSKIELAINDKESKNTKLEKSVTKIFLIQKKMKKI